MITRKHLSFAIQSGSPRVYEHLLRRAPINSRKDLLDDIMMISAKLNNNDRFSMVVQTICDYPKPEIHARHIFWAVAFNNYPLFELLVMNGGTYREDQISRSSLRSRNTYPILTNYQIKFLKKYLNSIKAIQSLFRMRTVRKRYLKTLQVNIKIQQKYREKYYSVPNGKGYLLAKTEWERMISRSVKIEGIKFLFT